MASRSRDRSSGGGRGAVPNEIIINVSAGETRVGIIEQQTLTELHIERARDRNVASMVAKGKVTRVLPGMQAAFVDIGLEKAAFLYVGVYLD
jgi:ribonuclease G